MVGQGRRGIRKHIRERPRWRVSTAGCCNRLTLRPRVRS